MKKYFKINGDIIEELLIFETYQEAKEFLESE